MIKFDLVDLNASIITYLPTNLTWSLAPSHFFTEANNSNTFSHFYHHKPHGGLEVSSSDFIQSRHWCWLSLSRYCFLSFLLFSICKTQSRLLQKYSPLPGFRPSGLDTICLDSLRMTKRKRCERLLSFLQTRQRRSGAAGSTLGTPVVFGSVRLWWISSMSAAD